MMYPYITLKDQTEITISELKSDGKVRVYVETPDLKDVFHNATCILPENEWREINGYTEEEMDYYRKLVLANTEWIMLSAQKENMREVM